MQLQLNFHLGALHYKSLEDFVRQTKGRLRDIAEIDVEAELSSIATASEESELCGLEPTPACSETKDEL